METVVSLCSDGDNNGAERALSLMIQKTRNEQGAGSAVAVP